MYTILSGLCIGVAIFSFIYYFILFGYANDVTFTKFWLILSLGCLAFWLGLRYVYYANIEIPQWIKMGMAIVLILVMVSFVWIEGLLIYYATQKHSGSTEYVIVLGARVRGDVPSLALYQRLRIASDYLKENPKVKVIVSGGQGPGEWISEAEAMERFLINEGVEQNRIIKEEDSTNTFQNIKYSLDLMGEQEKQVEHISIITSNFHVYRAVRLTRKIGDANVQGISAPVHPILTINFFVREYFAVVKDFIVGNI
jgi:uncharacterized SAM-binding protein YcdF (DUF218 family)